MCNDNGKGETLTIVAWPYPVLPVCIAEAIQEIHWTPDNPLHFEMGEGLNPLDPYALVKFIQERHSKPGDAYIYVPNHLVHWQEAKKVGLTFRIVELIPKQDASEEMEVGSIHQVDSVEDNLSRVWTSLRYSSPLAEIPSIYARKGRPAAWIQ